MKKEQTIIVGKIIKALRKKLLLSQEDLADFSQKDRNTISDLERDQYNPSLDTIFRLAAVLEIKPSELVRKIEEVEENAEYINILLREIEELKSLIKRTKDPNRMDNTHMNSLKFIDRSVSRLINEYNDEIEMEILKYQDHYKVVVTIGQEEPPYKDFIGVGTDKRSARRAAKKALKGLYLEAYDEE